MHCVGTTLYMYNVLCVFENNDLDHLEEYVSFVEMFIILCPYLGVSIIGGFTVFAIMIIVVIRIR